MLFWMLTTKVWFEQAFWRWKYQTFGITEWFRRRQFTRSRYSVTLKRAFLVAIKQYGLVLQKAILDWRYGPVYQ